MTALRAESFHAELASTRGEMRLVSQFTHAWHLQTAAGWIVTVSTARYDGPLAIRLTRHSLADLPVHPGVNARWDGQTLTVGSITIDLSASSSWQPPQHGDSLEVAMLRRDLCTAINHSRELDRGGISAQLLLAGLPLPTDPMQFRARAAVTMLKSATVQKDGVGIQRAVLSLVGLGPGLTPSGDDFLCGFAIGLAVLTARIEGKRPAVPVLVADAISNAWGRSTALGRTLLACAVGRLPLSGGSGPPVAIEPLLSVLWSLGTPDGVQGLETLLQIGHSSGSDMLAGAVVAAATLLEGGDVSDPTLVGSAQRLSRLH